MLTPPASISRPFPWADVMAIGLGLLRLPPRDFWAMTLPEFVAALRGLRGLSGDDAPFERPMLTRLMALFPDDGANHG